MVETILLTEVETTMAEDCYATFKIALLIVAIVFIYRYFKQRGKSQACDTKFDYLAYTQMVKENDDIRKTLDALHNLKTNVEMADLTQEMHKAFTLSWGDEISGEKVEATIFVFDRNDPSYNALMQLADTEISQVQYDAQKKAELLYRRSIKNGSRPPENYNKMRPI